MPYKYRIEKVKTGYVFKMYPSNNNNQTMGSSVKICESKDKCVEELVKFRKILNSIEKIDCLMNKNPTDGKFLPYFEYNGDIIFKREIPIEDEDYCIIWAGKIKDNCNAELK